jgi:hypothetical protein
VRKSRIWILRQFYHFFSLHGYVNNIAKKLPYPKIEKPASHLLSNEDKRRRESR